MAAEQGDGESQIGVGISYYNGIGVKKDHQEAVKWLRAGFLQNASNALESLEELKQKAEAGGEDARKVLDKVLLNDL